MADSCRGTISIPLVFVWRCEELHAAILEYIERENTENLTLQQIVEREEEWDVWSLAISIYDTDRGPVFNLRDSEASQGEFESLETICKNHSIPFDRETTGDWESDGDYTEWFRPGMECVQHTFSPGGTPNVDIGSIRKIIDEQEDEDIDESTILQQVIDTINKLDFNSPANQISNWCA